jgi:hypothetical protein
MVSVCMSRGVCVCVCVCVIPLTHFQVEFRVGVQKLTMYIQCIHAYIYTYIYSLYTHTHTHTHTHTQYIHTYNVHKYVYLRAWYDLPRRAHLGERNDIHDAILAMHNGLSLSQRTVCLTKKTRRGSLATAATRSTSVPHAIRSSRPGLRKNCV